MSFLTLQSGRYLSINVLKFFTVVLLQEVHQFVDDVVFQAIFLLLGKFQIEPDALGDDVAGPLHGLHLFDRPIVDLHTDDLLPFADQGFHPGFQPGPIPLLQHQRPVLDRTSGLFI